MYYRIIHCCNRTAWISLSFFFFLFNICTYKTYFFRTIHKPSSSLLFYHFEGFPFWYCARSFASIHRSKNEFMNTLSDFVVSVVVKCLRKLNVSFLVRPLSSSNRTGLLYLYLGVILIIATMTIKLRMHNKGVLSIYTC